MSSNGIETSIESHDSCFLRFVLSIELYFKFATLLISQTRLLENFAPQFVQTFPKACAHLMEQV